VPSGGAPGQAPRDQMAGQLLASAVASDNRGNMCCRQSAARTKLRTKQSSQQPSDEDDRVKPGHDDGGSLRAVGQ
jgi:hypothetical protein